MIRAIAVTGGKAPGQLVDVEVERPQPGPNDLLVEVRAVSVNPVDTKVRASAGPNSTERILGYDAAGIVLEVGIQVTLFKPGDEVYYAGDLTRSGTNAQLHLVDERIAGPKPLSLTHAEAAAVPLTAITAWEVLFERLRLNRDGGQGKRILILGASGGVGSMLTQLAAKLTQLEVIATASTPASQAWAIRNGAHRTINHHNLGEELPALGAVDYVASLSGTEANFSAICAAIAPQGAIAVIDDPARLDITPLKSKSVSVHWELMFTRSMFQTSDMLEQHRLLSEVSTLLDEGILRTTVAEVLSPIDAETMREAHARVTQGGTPGKIVVSGWRGE
ncbi:zinc-binding alcohol dehydrogenase family protein [Pseudoclavibacter terrae]|uniref:Zinc-type alcohol dehydrogenase-like protein n=1 Tax=Pseudoclavibacter terrae TaxID=1530195 RepID=A0A7J5B617_9MICO|nr:zinc-binding alcohol dehydrogenase family protein [Pseudoclavibacter terrae]KAB1638584.1 zinc-binding alcohol dehydrogenase family protein [Pseudoclavibacter terrae]